MSERLQDLASGRVKPKTGRLGAWFAGRARRREYWMWIVPTMILIMVLGALKLPAVTYFASLPVLFAFIRRLHDLGRSGWWAPVINMGCSVLNFAVIGLFDPCTSSDVLRQLGFGFSGEWTSSGVDI